MATSAVAVFGAAAWMFVTSYDCGNFPARNASLRSWSATRPSLSLMPPATRPVLLWYDTPGLVRLVQRLDKSPAVGRPGAGGGSCANGTPNATGCTWKADVLPGGNDDVSPAAAAPIAATAAAPVASDFTVMAVPSIRTSTRCRITGCLNITPGWAVEPQLLDGMDPPVGGVLLLSP